MVNIREDTENYGYDFSDFITIKPNNMIVNIFENGNFYISRALLKYFPNYEAEIKLKQDCSQLVLLKNGKEKSYLTQSGKSKQQYIVQKLKDAGLTFPVTYNGQWCSNDEIWIGDIQTK